jgi:Rrf2 family protein
MKNSMKADYAIHAMLHVAALDGSRATIDGIARVEGIPREYLAKVLLELVQAKLLRGQKGRKGGYYLVKPRSEYTFREILEAIDGPIQLVSCTTPVEKRTSHRKGMCPVSSFFDALGRKIVKDLDSVNLESIDYSKYYPVKRKEK